MLTLIREGGFPIWFVLAFGAFSLLCAARFALRPGLGVWRLALALSCATVFAILTAVAADLAQVGHQAPAYLARHPNESLPSVLLQGFAEAMSPAILGFSMLTVVALFMALGCYREPSDGEPSETLDQVTPRR